uniref:Carboxylesterase n=1 Tax=Cnaphalocrocis medinalis TaxID=437488 RepID=A0A0C5BXH5_CNAME|nr:carboxylesterase [Cnaphalocrocis medinalis]
MPGSKQTFLLPLAIFLTQSGIALSVTDPVVTTTLGLIRGVKADDGDYNMFMGIPYGRVNQSNPFGKAIPQEPFNGMFDAIHDTAMCPQMDEFNRTFVGSLDCLHLNIYVPTNPSSSPKPVMVMIHGGGFIFGAAGRFKYGPKYLVNNDVILVTINYRLGIYGFMCLATPEIPGNEGLKDQVLALRWIKKHIKAFGGDPNKITAFGNSVGALSVDFHMVSPQEKLFDQIILQSGSSLFLRRETPTIEMNKNAIFRLTRHFWNKPDEASPDNLNEALNFLATVNPTDMIAACFQLFAFFGPCLEERFEGVEGILIEDWRKASIPKAKQMPVLIGVTDQEALSSINSLRNEINNNFIRSYLDFAFKTDDPKFEGMYDLVQSFYLGDRNITDVNNNILYVINFISDFWYNYRVIKTVQKYLDYGASGIFLYIFSYIGERNLGRNQNNVAIGGAAHTDELGYLYDMSFYDKANEADQLTIDRMAALWTNFAKYGNPTPGTSALLPVEWKPITNGSASHYLEVDKELTAKTRPFQKSMAFWELFYRANADLRK